MNRTTLVCLALVLLPIAADAQCPEADTCCHAGQSATDAPDWESLHAVVAKARNCDDGWIAEAYSEKVSILLAEHWNLLEQLHVISKSEPWFLEFVLKHVDESVPADRWAKIRELATTRCPTGHAQLCDKIARQAAGQSP
jgi:hypothetical protein